MLIDDGSTEKCNVHANDMPAVSSLAVLRLRRNLGHQRALCVGLAFIEVNYRHQTIIVMDSDGEDRPVDIPVLLSQFQKEQEKKIVFAERRKRSETFVFQVGYVCYRYMHRLLTGYSVRVGNFSVIPRPSLSSLVVVPELWNHYAAAVFNSRLAYCSAPTVRGTRIRRQFTHESRRIGDARIGGDFRL